MSCFRRSSRSLPSLWATEMKANRRAAECRGAVAVGRTSADIKADPQTSEATRAWISRMEEKLAARPRRN